MESSHTCLCVLFIQAIILQSVVTTTTSPASVGAQEIVVQWLLRQADIDCDKQSRLYNTRTNPLNLWQQDPASLVKVSTLHFEFFKKHIQYLVSMVNWLETLSTESKPVEELRRLSVSRAETNKPETIAHLIDAEIDTCRTRVFEKVSNHFVALLLSSSEDVKRACLSLLKSKAHCHCGREFRLSHSSSLAGCAWFRLFSEATKYIRSTLRWSLIRILYNIYLDCNQIILIIIQQWFTCSVCGFSSNLNLFKVLNFWPNLHLIATNWMWMVRLQSIALIYVL